MNMNSRTVIIQQFQNKRKLKKKPTYSSNRLSAICLTHLFGSVIPITTPFIFILRGM